MPGKLVVFVHGWSVTSTASYGELPTRLRNESRRRGGPDLDVRQIHLGEYVSFHDEVRLEDIARAFDVALGKVLAEAGGRRRCVCITHSTGAPVVREWLDRQLLAPGRAQRCPISHLIMLAPANFGSALAQLGKGRVGAIKAWFEGIEPGQGVLDWLELASLEACRLNLRWIDDYPGLKLTAGRDPLFPFVLTGDAIDRRLYDHLNPYTGEIGSDGVVRVASANLNARHVVLRQQRPQAGEHLSSARRRLRRLEVVSDTRSAACAFRILPGRSHSGPRMGIMNAVAGTCGDDDVTVDSILRCLKVDDSAAYETLRQAFQQENASHQALQNRLEVEHVPVLPDREYIHDPCSMLVVRLFDSSGRRVHDVDVLMTAGPAHDPNQLPSGFMVDRQANRRIPGHLSFFLNHAVLAGCPPVFRPDGSIARAALLPRPPYGLRFRPRRRERFVEYWEAELDAQAHDLLTLIEPNQTTVLDVHLTRIVREGVFAFSRRLSPPHDFRDIEPGGVL